MQNVITLPAGLHYSDAWNNYEFGVDLIVSVISHYILESSKFDSLSRMTTASLHLAMATQTQIPAFSSWTISSIGGFARSTDFSQITLAGPFQRYEGTGKVGSTNEDHEDALATGLSRSGGLSKGACGTAV